MQNTIKNSYNHFQSGATLAEALYILPIFFIIIFGMVEMTFIYKAKNTLNLATSEAVRKGTLNNADLDSIKTGLSEGMAPLYASKDKCPGVGNGTVIAAGYNCARLVQAFMDLSSNQEAVTVISPTIEIFNAFKQELKVNVVGSTKEKNFVIPNGNLKWRDPTEKNVLIGGTNRPINIQDANLLKIKTYWCQKLSVPGLDRIFYNSVLRFSGSQEQKYCNIISQNNTAASITNTVFGKSSGYYIAIRSHALARMQSPVFSGDSNDNLLTDTEVSSITNPSTVTTPDDPIDETVEEPTEETPPPTIPPSGPETCDPSTTTCGIHGDDYCDANTGICYDCSTSPIGLCVETCNESTGDGCICETDTSNQTEINVSNSGNNVDPGITPQALFHPSPNPSTPTSTPSPVASTSKTLITTGLGKTTDQLISKSPTLVKNINTAIANGWTIKFGAKGSTASYADRDENGKPPVKIITMAEHFKNNEKQIVQILAHEIGHALHTPEKQILYTGLSKSDYVSQNTLINLRDEGAAVQKNIEIQREILANTTIRDATGKVTKKGIDIEIGGAIISKTVTTATGIKTTTTVDNTLSFNQAYDLFETGILSKYGLEDKIGRLYANHVQPSGGKFDTYYQYYQDIYIKHWDKHH